MKALKLALAVTLMSLVACTSGEIATAPSYYDGTETTVGLEYGDPGEMTLRDELLKLPWKKEVWMYKYSNDYIWRVTIGTEHLFLETTDNAIIAINRHTGDTAWKYHIDTGRPADWKPVEADLVAGKILAIEKKLWANKRAIDDAIKEFGPGEEVQKLQKKRREYREQLKVEQYGDNVYFVSRQILFCVDRRTGNKRWSTRLRFAPAARPFAIRNRVFISGADLSRVWVLDVDKKGDYLSWFRSSISGDGKNHIMNQPVYSDPTLFFVSHDSNVYAYDVVQKREKWTYKTERAIKSDPITYRFSQMMKDDEGKIKEKHYNILFVGGMDNTFYAIDADGGVIHWKYECGTPIQAKAHARGETVYIKTMDGALHAFDVNPQHYNEKGIPTGPVRSGKLRWKLPLGERFLVKGIQYVYVLGPDHTIYAMAEKSGQINGRYPIRYFSLLVTNDQDGIMYFVHPSGYIFAMAEK